MADNYYAPPQSELEVAPSSGGATRLPPDWGPVEVFKVSWELMQRNLGTWLAVAGIVFGVSLLMNILTQVTTFGFSLIGASVGDEEGVFAMLGMLVTFVMSLVAWPLNLWLAIGQTRMALGAVRGQPIEVGQLFTGLPWLLSAVGGALLIGLGVLFGTCLLVVPGVILGTGMMLFTLVVVDQDPGAVAAIERSWAITDGFKGRIFLTFFVGALAGLVITVCTCGTGALLFIALAPLFTVSLALMYETILDERPQLRVQG